MSARAKWSLYFAQTKGDKIIPLNSIKVSGEGGVTIHRIETEIIPLIQENNLQLPILVKIYFSDKGNDLEIVIRGGKPVFKPANPTREKFSFLITKDLKIVDISNRNIRNK